ncbi:hypothetical protein QJ856_gp0954 [Tupanvirus deep ocean]|uniref:Uncharacterized protein n=2 Tax=Tupanvirus TaxID=2094720 RepID=A0AC62A850_9VIRU|nr:hypothetical protein QJ856_gp0954 [Tupanvirus deep ocean]QKU33803.1 hypothetical protein [Tupanvirus deep ocean]
MISNNIILIIFILIVIGIVVYFYYNYKNASTIQGGNIHVTTKDKNTKKVRFNNNVEYNTYQNKFSTSNRLSDSLNQSPLQSPLSSPSRRNKIDVDSIFSSGLSSDSNQEEIDLVDDNSVSSVSSSPMAMQTICPSNLDQTDPEAMWDASFGLPLMTKEDKKKFITKMQKNHKDFQKSLGQFTQYQMDDSTIIKNDTTIDPFKSDHRSKSLKGRTVKEIYDEQVAGPKAKPKRIKAQTSTTTIYEDETEINGGKIKGTNLHAFDGINDGFKTAAFGNEF